MAFLKICFDWMIIFGVYMYFLHKLIKKIVSALAVPKLTPYIQF